MFYNRYCACFQIRIYMFLDVVFKSVSSDSCVTMVTETNMPYIDMAHEQLCVAIGEYSV